MKKLKLLSLLAIFFISCPSGAKEKDFMMCKIAGFYEGNNNRFLEDLAVRVSAKNNLLADKECTVAMKDGKEIGQNFSKPGRLKSHEDSEVIDEATRFSNLIYDSILSRVKIN